MSLLPSTKSEPVLISPRRSIGGLYPDVIIEESHEDSLEITSHPVEQGANISDHAFKKPKTLTIRGGVSDSSLAEGSKPSQEFYEKLLELQNKREPFEIVTGKRQYKNMLLESLSAVTDTNTENCLMFTAGCREVIIVKTQITSVPPRARHANPAKTGSTTDAGQKQPQEKETESSTLASATGEGKTQAEWEKGRKQ